MRELDRIMRNQAMLRTCYLPFALKIEALIRDVEFQTNERTGKHFRIRVQEAWRSPAEQLQKFNARVSKVRYGFHNCTSDDGRAESLAVDLVDDDFPEDPSNDLALLLASAAHAHGLMTGILWGLTGAEMRAVDRAIMAKSWKQPGDAHIEIGWDALHVQPDAGFTIAQAHRGERPF